MADIKFECDECSQRVEVPSDMVGSTITCPACGKKLVVPIMGPPIAPKEPAQSVKVSPLPRKQGPKRSFPSMGGGVRFEQQIPQLAGFICLLTGVALLARQQPTATYLPLLFLSFVLGVVSLVQKQIAAGIIVMLATILVPMAIRSGPQPQFAISHPPQVAPTPSWVDSVPKPVQRKIDPVNVTYPESSQVSRPSFPATPEPITATAAPAVVSPPAPRPISDDPFRDAFGPAPGEETATPEPAPKPVAAADPPGAPQESSTFASTAPILESDRVCLALAGKPEDVALLAQLKEEIKAITNPTKRTRLMAAYSLGCLYVGRAREAGALTRYLEKQHPDNIYVKLLSLDNTTGPCAKCFGSGHVESDCLECSGKGQCSGCSGTGNRQLNALNGQARKVTCGKCRGSGKCRKCQGTGKMKGKCPECKGSKNVFSLEKVKQGFLSALGDKLGGSE